LSSFYCRGAGCAIIAYDITTQSSFKNVQKWVTKLRTSQPDKDCFIILVGTKLDCCKDDKIPRAVEYEMAEKMKEQIGAIAFVETSAKTGENVETVFEHIVKNISKFSSNEKSDKDTLTIDGGKKTDGGSGSTGCCG
jgi:GTPase SAR1 family protein